MKVFVQDERDMLNTDIFSTVVIQEFDDLEYDSLEDLSTLQKSLDEVKGNADIIDDENDSNDDDDSSFESSIVSFSVTNEAESLLCDPHYDTYFRLLDRTDSEIADNQSNCSSETLRRRKVFVEDERNMLNTEIFLPYDAEETSELESLCHFEIERDENNIRKLLVVNTNLDEVKVDDDDNDDGIKDDGDNNDDSNNVENNTNNDDDDDEERSDDANNDKEKEEEKKKIQDDDDDDDGKNDKTSYHKPSKRIPPSGPFLLLSEDNKSLYKVSNTSTTPVFTEIPLKHPLPPPKYIKPLSDTALLQQYTVLPTGSKYIKPLPDTALLQQCTFLPTLPTPPPSPPKPTSTTTLTIQQQPNDNDNDDNDNNNNKNENNDNDDDDDDEEENDDNDKNDKEKNDNSNSDDNDDNDNNNIDNNDNNDNGDDEEENDDNNNVINNNNDNDDDSDDSDDNNNSNDNENDHNEEEKNDNNNADNNIIEAMLSNRNIKRESDNSFSQQTNKKIKISTNNEEKDDDFIFDSNGLFDNSVSDVSTSLFSDSDSDNEIENKEKNNRVKLAKLILTKKDINKKESKSDDLEKIKKDIPPLINTEILFNSQPKDFKKLFTSDLGHFICAWLFVSLSDNKLSYKYNPKAIVDVRLAVNNLNSALYTPTLVSQK